MFKSLKSKLALGSAAVTGLVMTTAANAAVDVTGVVTEISGNQASVAAVGGAVLTLIVGAAVFKYIRRAL